MEGKFLVLHKRLGEDFMPMLPDTVPFLAELMEGKFLVLHKRLGEDYMPSRVDGR